MIYFMVTTSLFVDDPVRKQQYTNAITKLKQVIRELDIQNFKIIVIENNGLRKTFLDDLGCEVCYTTNNWLPTVNKGYKELVDIRECINRYNVNDADFIVKMTGRYVLNSDSPFMAAVKNIHDTKYECILRYGSFIKPLDYKTDDCITGLIGMSCYYVKQIKIPQGYECVEWNWAKCSRLIDDSKVHLVKPLGINICPGPFCNTYYMV